jgi:hypothetical protein
MRANVARESGMANGFGRSGAVCSAAGLALLIVCDVARGIDAPGIGVPVIQREIRVTLLGVKRLSLDEYQSVRGIPEADWAGGGLRFAFLTENRPGAALPPALGEVRVFFGSRLYNPVTNASSTKPFAPLIFIRTVGDFYTTQFGRTVRSAAPAPRPATLASILDVSIRGTTLPPGPGFVELEQGETYRPDAAGQLRMLSPAEMGRTWMDFRFEFPAPE